MAEGFTVRTSGPVFDGSFAMEMRRAAQEIEQELGDQLVERIQERLDTVLVNPTGFYRSQIRAEPRGEITVVNDSGVVYGPWLEGVGSRNKTTRFKGYSTFRKVAQEFDREAPKMADEIVMKYVR